MGWGAKLPGKFLNLNPLNPKSDQYLIPPYSNTADPFIKNMRMKEMVAKLVTSQLADGPTRRRQLADV